MSAVSSRAMADSSFLTGPRIIVPPGPTPSALDKHFDFLEWSPDGDTLLLGSSDLTSRSWVGSLWIFSADFLQNASTDGGLHPLAEQCLVGAQVDCGVNVGRFLRCSDKFVIGCDSGTIQVLALKSLPSIQKKLVIEGEASLTEHNDIVLDIDDLGGDGLHFLSCSQDKSIKVWDLESLVATYTYSPAHAHSVTSVRARPSQAHSFASCARDGSALLWDTRDELPASCLINTAGIGLTALSWVDEMTIVAGGVDGQLRSVDLRNTSQIQSSLQLEKRPVHLMKSNPNSASVICSSAGQIGACQDTSKVSVLSFKGESPKIMYTHDSHGDLVRGLSWNQKSLTLWSCGWDTKIFSHHMKSAVNGSA